MGKFDYRNVLVSGNKYECGRTKTGRIYLFYYENGLKKVYAFDDTMHEGFLSSKSIILPPGLAILEVVSIDYINYETGYTHFTGLFIY